MEDAVKKRQEYLRKKTKVILPAVIAGLLGVALIGLVLKLAFLPSRMSNYEFGAFVLFEVLMIPCTFVIISCEKKASSIPYVPPIREQIPALSAGESLLRGSHPPATAPAELLRAAKVGAGTEAEELLRITGVP